MVSDITPKWNGSSHEMTRVFAILIPAPHAEAVLFSLIESEVGGGGEARGEELLVGSQVVPVL